MEADLKEEMTRWFEIAANPMAALLPDKIGTASSALAQLDSVYLLHSTSVLWRDVDDPPQAQTIFS